MNDLKRIAVINDLSGSSRCSLTVAIPIIAAKGLQCCVMPTAILSNHTGYEHYFFDDYTDKMEHFTSNWQKQNLDFEGIYTGFLGSEHQIEVVTDFICKFKKQNTKLIVDPVMGDDGKIYTTYTHSMCSAMKKIASQADVVTPNITEACVLADTEYQSEFISEAQAKEICQKIYCLGAKNVVLTGVKEQHTISNFVYDGNVFKKYSSKLLPTYFSGTGDVFSSIVASDITKGKSIFESVEFATNYIHKVTEYSQQVGLTWGEGICIEKYIKDLI
jgi:pyridoxine kinase